MKIAISSQGKRRDAQVELWFGRAAYYLIVNTDNMTVDALENEAAGDSADIDEINAARLVINAGAQAVLTGNCGLDARHMFATAGVKLFQGVPETVEEAVEQFKDGKLTDVPAPGIRQPVEVGAAEDWTS
jgi:predicted Fe-Mo cluster-binding NifX family protein